MADGYLWENSSGKQRGPSDQWIPQSQEVTIQFNLANTYNPVVNVFMGEVMPLGPVLEGSKQIVTILDWYTWSVEMNWNAGDYGDVRGSNIINASTSIGLRSPTIPFGNPTGYESFNDNRTLGIDQRSYFKRQSDYGTVPAWDVNWSNVPGENQVGNMENSLGGNAVVNSYAPDIDLSSRKVYLNKQLWPFYDLQFVGGINWYGSEVIGDPEEDVTLRLTFHYELHYHKEELDAFKFLQKRQALDHWVEP
jgi:hypothetical protein